jgi:hypothetical protein
MWASLTVLAFIAAFLAGFGSDPPKPPPPQAPPDTAAADAAAAAETEKARRRRGRQANVLTTPTGSPGYAALGGGDQTAGTATTQPKAKLGA